MKNFVIVASFLILLTPAMSFADHSHGTQKAKDAFNAGDYKTAMHLWQEEAERGELVAMEMLGAIYASGKGVPQDYGKALKWHMMAAKRGSASSQFNLGKLYYKGLGLEKSLAHSYAWLLVATAEGNVGAKEMAKTIKGEILPEEIEISKEVVFEILEQLSLQD